MSKKEFIEIQDYINERFLRNIYALDKFLIDMYEEELSKNRLIRAIKPTSESLLYFNVSILVKNGKSYKYETTKVSLAKLEEFLNDNNHYINLNSQMVDGQLVHSVSLLINGKEHKVDRNYDSIKKAKLVGVFNSMMSINNEEELEIIAQVRKERENKKKNKTFGMGTFEDTIFSRKGTVGEDIFKKFIFELQEMYPGLQMDLLENTIEGQPHSTDYILVNRKTQERFKLEIKSKKMRDDLFWDTGIKEYLADRYAKDKKLKTIIVFIDHSGYPDFDKIGLGTFDYEKEVFTKDLILNKRGMMYGNTLDNLRKPCTFKFKTKNGSFRTVKYPFKKEYPIKADGVSKDIEFYPMPNMLPITTVLGKAFNFDGIDRNLSFIKAADLSLLRALTRTMKNF